MRNYQQPLQEARTLGGQYAQARTAAYRRNPDLTPDAQERAISEVLAQVQQSYGPRFDALVVAAKAERDAKVAAAAKARPRLDVNDTAALVRSQQAWEGTVRPLLDRGLSLADALALADTDGVIGAERFAPTYLALQSADLTADQRGVVARQVALAFARLAPDERTAAAILDGAAAEVEFTSAASAIEKYRSGDPLGAAVTLQYADAAPSLDGGEAPAD